MKTILMALSILCIITNSFAYDTELKYQNNALGKLNSLAESYSDGYDYEVLLVTSQTIGHSNLGLRYGRPGQVSSIGYNSWLNRSLITGKEVSVTFLTLSEKELREMGFKAAPGLIFLRKGKYIGHKVGFVYPESKIGRYFLEFLESPMSLDYK